MALLVNIETATEVASVSISRSGHSLAFRKSENQREHASFVHAAIAEALREAGIALAQIDAFAVTSGPGSYTGLRVGMATAKGFCYAFSRPLITLNTLEVMASAAVEVMGNADENVLLCPMIDARRMEVFTGLFDNQLENILPVQPLVLTENSFNNFITKGKIVFFGSGSKKFRPLIQHQNAVFGEVEYDAKNLGRLADTAFQEEKFADVSYSQPNYFKDFHFAVKC